MKSIGEIWGGKLREICERGKALAATPEAIAKREAWEAEQARREGEEARERLREAWKLRGVPPRLWDALEGAKVMTSALREVQKFTEGNGWALLLSGSKGTGKTFAAAWAAAHRPGAVFTKAAKIQASGPFDRESRERFESAPLLVIDDLGREIIDQKQFSRAYLFQLLDARYDNASKTIITTNANLGDFQKTYGSGAGELLMDRLREGGTFFHVEEEESLRGLDPDVMRARALVSQLDDETTEPA